MSRDCNLKIHDGSAAELKLYSNRTVNCVGRSSSSSGLKTIMSLTLSSFFCKGYHDDDCLLNSPHSRLTSVKFSHFESLGLAVATNGGTSIFLRIPM